MSLSVSAYERRGDNRMPRLPPGNFNRVDAPAIRPNQSQFQTPRSGHSMQNACVAMGREEQQRQLEQQEENQRREEEEHTENGIQEVGPDDFDEDDDEFIAMNSPQPPQQQQKEKENNENRKRRHESSSDNGRDDDQSAGTSQEKRPRNENATAVLVSIPWILLKEKEYKYYKPGHLIVDPNCCPNCVEDESNNEQTHMHETAEFNSVYKTVKKYHHAISEDFKKELLFIDPPMLSFGNDEVVMNLNNNNEQPIERIFRKLVDNPAGRFIPISHQPNSTASAQEEEVFLQKFSASITTADFQHFKISQQSSYQESVAFKNVINLFSILHTKTLVDPHNVLAWLEYIDLQPAYHDAKQAESSEAPNRKADYEDVMEIVRRAIAANRDNVDLHIKKFLIMEEHYGAQHSVVKNEWNCLMNVFMKNRKLWEFSIKRQMNNGETFRIKKTVKHIDECIDKLVWLKNRSKSQYMEGDDEFLVDLLVTRCRLLISAGFIDRAIAMLQALAEFHFFRPYHLLNDPRLSKHDRSIRALNEFQTFWEYGVPRIGDTTSSAEGWASFNATETNRDEWIDDEFDQISGENDKIREADKEEINTYKFKGLTIMEATRRLEQFRTRKYWTPVRHKHENALIYEHESRITSFLHIKSILFIIDDIKICQNLIYKMLHIFGVSVLGLDFNLQEDILRAFSPTLFPSFRQNSLGLEKFSEFIENFVKQLAESKQADSARIYTALATNISNSGSEHADKIKGLKNLTRNINTLKGYNTAETINKECQLAICISAFEERVKLEPTDTKPRTAAWKILFTNLDMESKTFWGLIASSPNVTNDEQQTLRKTGLFYLRFILFIARNLPFSDADETERKESDIGRVKWKQNMPKTKREFLLSIWALGQVSTIPASKENIKMARERVSKYLKKSAPPKDENSNFEEFRWIGNEQEILFELATLFVYEFSVENHGKIYDKFPLFQKDRPLFTSELAKSLTYNRQSAVPMEVRVHVLQHITRVHKELAHDDLINFMGKQVLKFPHSIPLLKALFDNFKNVSMHKRFLWMNTGNDNLTRLIRDCGQLYTARIRLDAVLNTSPTADKREITIRIGQFVSIYKSVAEKHSDNLVPDDYIWLTLIRTMVDKKEKDTISYKSIDEIFTRGQAVCPWSKAFLFESSKDRPSFDNFPQTLNGLIKKHGLSQYCTDEEIKSRMTQNFV